jgi:hypothetical protein
MLRFLYSCYMPHYHLLLDLIVVLLLGQTKHVLILISSLFSDCQNVYIIFSNCIIAISLKFKTEVADVGCLLGCSTV